MMRCEIYSKKLMETNISDEPLTIPWLCQILNFTLMLKVDLVWKMSLVVFVHIDIVLPLSLLGEKFAVDGDQQWNIVRRKICLDQSGYRLYGSLVFCDWRISARVFTCFLFCVFTAHVKEVTSAKLNSSSLSGLLQSPVKEMDSMKQELEEGREDNVTIKEDSWWIECKYCPLFFLCSLMSCSLKPQTKILFKWWKLGLHSPSTRIPGMRMQKPLKWLAELATPIELYYSSRLVTVFSPGAACFSAIPELPELSFFLNVLTSTISLKCFRAKLHRYILLDSVGFKDPSFN